MWPDRPNKYKENSHNDDKKKGWNQDKYVALHKEWQTIMESLADYGKSGIHNSRQVHCFL